MRAFVLHYCDLLHAENAAIAAGYPQRSARSRASQLRARDDVSAAIEEEFDRLAISKSETLHRLGQQARAEYAQFMNDEGEVDIGALKRAGLGHLIKSVSDTAHGKKVEFYDAQSALTWVGKHYSMFVDRSEVSGPNGGPIETHTRLTADKLAEMDKEASEQSDRINEAASTAWNND